MLKIEQELIADMKPLTDELLEIKKDTLERMIRVGSDAQDLYDRYDRLAHEKTADIADNEDLTYLEVYLDDLTNITKFCMIAPELGDLEAAIDSAEHITEV